MIKIVSGYSGVGGSTEAFITLTNEFNRAGYEALFIGPHVYPQDKCNFFQTQSPALDMKEDDTIIFHYTEYRSANGTRPDVKNIIYSCHEQTVKPMATINYWMYDKIHYVSNHQKEWQNIRHPSFVIPNAVERLEPSKCQEKVAGVVGNIWPNKCTHKAIKKALSDGFDKVLIYGGIGDHEYWNSKVGPLVDSRKVEYHGQVDNKQDMYNTFSDLYHFSDMETYSMVITEAMKCGIKVHTPKNKNYMECERILDNDIIIKQWVKELCL